MVRRLLVVCVAIGISVVTARPALAQGEILAPGKHVGGGLGYTFDEHSDFLVITGLGWLPINGPDIVFKPIVAAPRFQVFPGLDRWQVDVDGLWDIPVAPELNVRPYLGMGVGLSHSPGETTPLVNFDAGFRYKRPNWKHQLAFEVHYSAGLDYFNTMVMNVVVLFPIGRQ
jgi:hypothetical protein